MRANALPTAHGITLHQLSWWEVAVDIIIYTTHTHSHACWLWFWASCKDM